MNIFLGYDQISKRSRVKISMQHFFPELLSAKELQKGILVDFVPEPEVKLNKKPVLFANLDTKDVWYEYEDLPLNERDLRQRVEAMEEALVTVLFGGDE